MKKKILLISLVLALGISVTGCGETKTPYQQDIDLINEYSQIGYIHNHDGKTFLVNYAGIEDLHQVGVNYIELNGYEASSSPYTPIKVEGTLNMNTGEMTNVVTKDFTPEDFENKYFLAYYNLVKSGALSKIQKYTNLAITLLLEPDNQEAQKEFDTITDVKLNWSEMMEALDPSDELLLSLTINCEQLFDYKNKNLAESVINQLNELIQKAGTF